MHKSDESNLQWFMFGFCDYKTIDASDLKDHESKQHEIWHCSKCEYGALDKSLLENHIGIHTGGINLDAEFANLKQPENLFYLTTLK